MAGSPGITDTGKKLKEMNIGKSEMWETANESLNINPIEVDLNTTLNPKTSFESFHNSSEFTFDNVIGYLEDMLIDEDFHLLQNSFLEKYWKEFDDNEENKHCYMTIFNEYTQKIEEFIVRYLKEKIEDFEMDLFASELEQRRSSLEGEIFEVLLTLSDFEAFKEIFLEYRAMKEGHGVDLGSSLCVSSVPLSQ